MPDKYDTYTEPMPAIYETDIVSGCVAPLLRRPKPNKYFEEEHRKSFYKVKKLLFFVLSAWTKSDSVRYNYNSTNKKKKFETGTWGDVAMGRHNLHSLKLVCKSKKKKSKIYINF